MKEKITKDMTLGEIAAEYPEAVDVLLKYGLHCIGCHVAAWETLEQGAMAHGLYGGKFDKLLNELNQINQPKKKNTIDRKKEIKSFIRQIKTKKNTKELKEKAKNILKDISPEDLGYIEQELIQEGITREEMKKLCDIHIEVMGESLAKTEINLEQGHPVHTLMEEHKIILEFIEKLQIVVHKIELAKSFNGLDKELEILTHIGEHLVEADKHHQREEDALFPILEKFGVTEPPAIMREEHKELRAKKNELCQIAKDYKNISYVKFVKKIKNITEYLSKELSNHIYKENNILYPMAIEAIPKKEWIEIKRQCDKIGYCCFTPKVEK